MPSPSQGRGYASTESTVSSPDFQTPTATCANAGLDARSSVNELQIEPVSYTAAFRSVNCPMCDCDPVDPVRCEGQMACRSCTSSCVICTAACPSGDETCGMCSLLATGTLQGALA